MRRRLPGLPQIIRCDGREQQSNAVGAGLPQPQPQPQPVAVAVAVAVAAPLFVRVVVDLSWWVEHTVAGPANALRGDPEVILERRAAPLWRSHVRRGNPGHPMLCGQWIDIEKAAGRPNSWAVYVPCKHCQKTATFSIKKWGLKEVKEMIV